MRVSIKIIGLVIVMIMTWCAPVSATDGIERPLEFAVPKGAKSSLEFPTDGGGGARIEVTPNNVTLRVHDTSTIIQRDRSVGFGLDETYFKIADFNFDGQLDVAVSSSTGYGGVNVFFDIFLINGKTTRAATKALEICNPVRHLPTKSLLSYGCKSGPSTDTKWYRYGAGEFRLWATSQDADGNLAKFELVTGQKIISEFSTPGLPALRPITVENARTYHEANAQSVSGDVLKLGHIVAIIDIVDQQWALVMSAVEDLVPIEGADTFWIDVSDILSEADFQ